MKGILSIQSHVVYGHAGNSSAVFPIQRMGLETWPIHTVQYSNHTQYEQGWKGQRFNADEITTIVNGLDDIGQLSNCDPVMGDPDKGCILPEGVTEELIQTLMPIADVIVPNQFELTQFTGVNITSLYDAITACKKAIELGPRFVLVKHLSTLSEGVFSSLLATPKACYLVQRPEIEFDKPPVGVGDLITSVFTACLVKGMSPVAAFRHTNNAVYGVLEVTQDNGEWELQTILGQYEFVEPTHDFEPKKVA
ncbi:pyridoxal kinase [Vibrio aestuarianus]|uniref:pyridoxal kinase n=1 Tax=Vibrio aestuarianus TaxID=28171 RepID=UPI00155915FE|nr:pyridoxal kinase [Vibrio aestuarianus]NGZ14130.1 pyridoxal kinase [Vibrio aestuarianus]NKZ50278.1 pyridoxal kinase [Vibrio aestuarianus]